MFEVVCTGKNRFYGKKDEHKLLSDTYILVALKNGWITDNFKYVGDVKQNRRSKIPVKEELMPVKRINVMMTLEQQNEALKKLSERIDSLFAVNKKLLYLLKHKR